MAGSFLPAVRLPGGRRFMRAGRGDGRRFGRAGAAVEHPRT
ncbi:hypothetical protein ABZ128_17225 [Streptomyces sp. NPDC006326]